MFRRGRRGEPFLKGLRQGGSLTRAPDSEPRLADRDLLSLSRKRSELAPGTSVIAVENDGAFPAR